MKILSVIDIPWNSGLAAYAFDQARALRAAGHSVTFACPRGSAAMEFAAREGFASFPIPGRKEHLRLPAAVIALARLVRAEKIACVCAHTGLAQTYAWLLKRLAPTLAVVRVKADAKPPTAGFTFSSVDRVISASAYIEGLYLAAGLAPAKSALIRQGIVPPPFSPPPAARPLSIGILGRLDPVKGHAVFLKAAAELLKGGLDARFHVAGYEAGVKYADLEKQAAALGIGASVVFHGRVEGPYPFINGCDLGVIASLGSEAVSRAALEWLAAGRPLVSTSAGSLPEFAPAELLVPPGDHAALAAKIAALAASPEKMAAAGAANRRKAVSEFSIGNFEKATCGAVEAACGARN